MATIWQFAASYCYCFISVLSVHLHAHSMPNFSLGPCLDICPFRQSTKYYCCIHENGNIVTIQNISYLDIWRCFTSTGNPFCSVHKTIFLLSEQFQVFLYEILCKLFGIKQNIPGIPDCQAYFTNTVLIIKKPGFIFYFFLYRNMPRSSVPGCMSAVSCDWSDWSGITNITLLLPGIRMAQGPLLAIWGASDWG